MKGYFKTNVLLISIKSFKQILQVLLLLQFFNFLFTVLCVVFMYRNHTITILSDMWNWNTSLSTLQMIWWFKVPMLQTFGINVSIHSHDRNGNTTCTARHWNNPPSMWIKQYSTSTWDSYKVFSWDGNRQPWQSSEQLLHNKTRNSAGMFLTSRTACLSVFTYADVFIYIQQLLDDTIKYNN